MRFLLLIIIIALIPVTLIFVRWSMIQLGLFWKPIVKLCCKIGWHWETEVIGYTENMDATCTGCKQFGYIDSNNNFHSHHK